MIEFLVNELIEQGGECLIQTEDADQMVSFSFYLTIKKLSFQRGNLKEISEEFNILQNKYMGLENKHQEEMRLMKLEVNNIILAYNLQALGEKVSLKNVHLSFFL